MASRRSTFRSKHRTPSDYFCVLNNAIEMTLLEQSFNRRIFRPPQPHEWMLNHQFDECFRRVLRNYLKPFYLENSKLTTDDLIKLLIALPKSEYLRMVCYEQTERSGLDHNSAPPIHSVISPAPQVISAPTKPLPAVLHHCLELHPIPVKVTRFDFDAGKRSNDVYGLTSAFQGSQLEERSVTKIFLEPASSSSSTKSVRRGNLYDVLIYAPPHSGKTTFQTENQAIEIHGYQFTGFHDTDNIYYQDAVNSRVTFTNMSHLISKSRYSIAFVPSKREFYERCRKRGVLPSDKWYLGLCEETEECDITIYADDYLREAFANIAESEWSKVLKAVPNTRASDSRNGPGKPPFES